MGDYLANYMRNLTREQHDQKELELHQRQIKELEHLHLIESRNSKEATSIIEWDYCQPKPTFDRQTLTNSDTGNHAGTTEPREGHYKLRDEFAIQQVKDRPELLEMRAGGVKKELKKASNLFTSGYDGWWRKNPVFNKSDPGRNPK